MSQLRENSRTYIFPEGKVSVIGVRNLEVSKSGGHRLTQADGGMVYIPNKWLAIAIDSDYGWEA